MTKHGLELIERLKEANVRYTKERVEIIEQTYGANKALLAQQDFQKFAEIAQSNCANEFLDKMVEVEHYSKLGGYIPDMYGMPCHAGDTIQVVGWKEEPVGVLTWMKSHLQFCIVCSDGKRYRLGEYHEGIPRVVMFKKIEAQAASKGVTPLGQGKKG